MTLVSSAFADNTAVNAAEKSTEKTSASETKNFWSKVTPGLWNAFTAYNRENGDWEETSTTITYMENVVQPFLQFNPFDGTRFRLGAGLVVPMNQEQKIRQWYPYVQSHIDLGGDSFLDLGNLEPKHDFPAPILDPLTSILPQLRLGSASSQVPITYETWPVTGAISHGMYEYGISYRWNDSSVSDRGELYMNWQLPDTTNHRERFDVGLTARNDTYGVPLYLGAHYWHNGGHENPHPVEVTENYTVAFGLRTNTYNVLLLGSILFPDRAIATETQAGTALYADYKVFLGRWYLQPILFVSDEMRNSKNRYISVEGDPFFRVPMYLGLNVGARWEIFPKCNLDLVFINGLFQRHGQTGFHPTVPRYDQMLRLQFVYLFGEQT